MSIEQAKRNVIREADRVRGERRILEDRLRELRAAVQAGSMPVHGFNLRDIEQAAAAPAELYARIDGIEAALRQDFFDDPAFCRGAQAYLREIEAEVLRLDRRRGEIAETVEKLQRELEKAGEAAEKERTEIDSRLAELFEPLGETVYSHSGHVYRGGYVLHKLQALAEKGA